ncbi:ATP-binding cassette domain-containing protein [Caldimonas tepidiphila]|uniref:phosphatase domain-containing putative toxin n=1 Tax=Caldimonas tepidiphila TaxID=2315841 RepID=UPI000E5BAE91|nr:ATP-binding cassette domain-containing protein [Caldimonas tepidiphila]
MSRFGLLLDGFGVAFGERTVLRSVSFGVPQCGCTALLGPSGTGKSTLLRTLAGYNDANPSLRTWGAVRLGEAPPADGLQRPALVMQKPQLLVSTVMENLVCELPNRSDLRRTEQNELVREALERYGLQPRLQPRLHDKVIGCPPTEQRLIAILRMALAQPAVLMVDEPTSGLTPEQAAPVLELLRQLARERALLVVMHHQLQTREIADQVVLLANGIVQEAAGVEAFFSDPRSEAARAFVRTGSCPEEAQDAGEEACEETCEGACEEARDASREETIGAAAPPPPAVTDEAPPVPADIAPAVAARPPGRSAAYGPRGFVWLIPGRLGGTPLPGIFHDVRYDLDALQSVGITRLVSLTETPFDPALAAPFGIRCTPCPIDDMAAPTLTTGWQLCADIDRHLRAGEVIAVHCKAGLGRTGTILAAYWIWQGMGRIGALQALEHVRRMHPGWVQSDTQVRFLEEFARVVAKNASVMESASRRLAPHP